MPSIRRAVVKRRVPTEAELYESYKKKFPGSRLDEERFQAVLTAHKRDHEQSLTGISDELKSKGTEVNRKTVKKILIHSGRRTEAHVGEIGLAATQRKLNFDFFNDGKMRRDLVEKLRDRTKTIRQIATDEGVDRLVLLRINKAEGIRVKANYVRTFGGPIVEERRRKRNFAIQALNLNMPRNQIIERIIIMEALIQAIKERKVDPFSPEGAALAKKIKIRINYGDPKVQTRVKAISSYLTRVKREESARRNKKHHKN